jgi:hypothetical protein
VWATSLKNIKPFNSVEAKKFVKEVKFDYTELIKKEEPVNGNDFEEKKRTVRDSQSKGRGAFADIILYHLPLMTRTRAKVALVMVAIALSTQVVSAMKLIKFLRKQELKKKMKFVKELNGKRNFVKLTPFMAFSEIRHKEYAEREARQEKKTAFAKKAKDVKTEWKETMTDDERKEFMVTEIQKHNALADENLAALQLLFTEDYPEAKEAPKNMKEANQRRKEIRKKIDAWMQDTGRTKEVTVKKKDGTITQAQRPAAEFDRNLAFYWARKERPKRNQSEDKPEKEPSPFALAEEEFRYYLNNTEGFEEARKEVFGKQKKKKSSKKKRTKKKGGQSKSKKQKQK